MIRLQVDASEVEHGLMVLGDGAPLAIARALNRTTSNVKTVMVRAVSGSLRIRQKFVRDRVFETKATRSRLNATLSADNRPIPLIAFNAKGPEPSRGRGKGVSARTARRRYPRAFIATMRSGHRGVFEREGKARLKIRELREASVAAVWMHHEAVGRARGQEQLPKNLAHEVEYLLTTKVQRAVRRRAGV